MERAAWGNTDVCGRQYWRLHLVLRFHTMAKKNWLRLRIGHSERNFGHPISIIA